MIILEHLIFWGKKLYFFTYNFKNISSCCVIRKQYLLYTYLYLFPLKMIILGKKEEGLLDFSSSHALIALYISS